MFTLGVDVVYLCIRYTSTSVTIGYSSTPFYLYNNTILWNWVINYLMKTLLAITLIFTFTFYHCQNSETIEEVPNHVFANIANGWTYLGESVTKIKYYVKDIESNDSYSKNYVCWVKTFNAPKSYKDKKGNWITKQSDYSIERWKIYCNSKKYALLSYVNYNSKGQVTSSGKLSGEIDEVILETMSEAVLNFVCSKP